MGLKEKAVNGLVWTSTGTIGAGLINFIITLILARLLSPTDFGLIELLIIFTAVSDVFIDSGFSQAVIRDKHATSTDLSSVFYINIVIASILYTVLFLAAPLIAGFYNAPHLIPLSRFVFLTIIFNSFSIIQNANFNRQLKFRPYAVASVVAMCISGIVAIILALKGFGVWALAVNMVMLSFLRMLILWLQSSWRPKLVMSYHSIKRYFAFGSNLLIQGITDKIVTNLESLVIGRIYSKGDLGYFSQARKLNSYLGETSFSVIQKVTYPVLASIGDDYEKLKAGYRKIVGVTLFCMTPISFYLVAASENVMDVLFGSQWLPSSPYLRLWSVTSWIVILYSVFINIYLVTGKSGRLLRLAFIRQLFRVLTIILLAHISIYVMLWGIVITTVITGTVYMYNGGKLIGYSLKEVFYDLWKTVLWGIIAAVCTYAVGNLMVGFRPVYILLLQGVTMLSVYLLSNRISRNEYLEESLQVGMSLIKKMKKK
ncbi:lipopolysaccharide biosynthesis protein [Coprobacter tertius]|uniref:Lipopolysaccharide biosynthesis protein n=1 Tax=Coprobacter tertius TaxID=2944915 RepID=A0ABT1MK41_9BACT|nr:lipopolysaccharide biosynthesis protein [Coprobacter tertius]MCP9613007.1 lipopolysaccharide biosynthesis protein [Coprobacter tertius]